MCKNCCDNQKDSSSSFIFGLVLGLIAAAVVAVVIYKYRRNEVITTLKDKLYSILGLESEKVSKSSHSPKKEPIPKSKPGRHPKMFKRV